MGSKKKNKASITAVPSGEKLSGRSGFESYYGSLYGQRWESLKAAFFAGKFFC